MNKEEILLKLASMLLSDDLCANKQETQNKGRYIVIGNRGNIVVGDLTIIGSTGYLKNASVIRRWGTTKGLGQLALEGPTSDTKLDHCGEFEFELLTTCGMIPVKSDF